MTDPIDSEPPDGEWRPFDVATVAAAMDAVTEQWWLSGGVALDRFLGAETREHGDIDISMPVGEFTAVTTMLAGSFDVRIARSGRLYPLAAADSLDAVHNLWVRESVVGPWRFQLNLEPTQADRWIYRRDPRITRPLVEVVRTIDAVRCVAPEVQLLWKTAAPTPKDELDWTYVIPRLDRVALGWLRDAVRVAHPDSPWFGRFTEE